MKTVALLALLILVLVPNNVTHACAAVGPTGKPIVNADQTVVIIWDAKTKTQHFIRQASFRGTAEQFGFLIPTPSVPEIAEAGDTGFDVLKKCTEPERRTETVQAGIGCSSAPSAKATKGAARVDVLKEQIIGGLHTVVLEAATAGDLVAWLRDNGFAFSPEVEAWAKPYIGAGWKIFAYKLAKGAGRETTAKTLRLSFKTERPIFPYREPDVLPDADGLKGAAGRLLRIYVLSDARFEGLFSDGTPWKSTLAWSGPLLDLQARDVAESLMLPADTLQVNKWLTEFEHNWPYGAAPGDVYFERDLDQSLVVRPAIITYVESYATLSSGVMLLIFAGVMLGVLYLLRPIYRYLRGSD